MDLLEIIGLVGSLVSIGSAIWVYSNVGVIEETKNEIFSRLRLIKYSESINSSKGAISQLRKVVNKIKIPPGTNFDDIIDSLNDYYEKLNSIRNEIKEDGYSELEKQLKVLKRNINTASKINISDTKKTIDIYTKIYYHILEIDTTVSNFNKQILEK